MNFGIDEPEEGGENYRREGDLHLESLLSCRKRESRKRAKLGDGYINIQIKSKRR